MIIVKVKLKTDAKTYTETLYLDDYYTISKSNPDFEQKIKSVCDKSPFNPIDEVKISIRMEW